jgi:hypothetical protein
VSGRNRATALCAYLTAVVGTGCVTFAQHSIAIDPAGSQNASAALPAPGSIQFSWTRSLPVNYEDPSIGTFGGTELRAIVALGGKLYAANDYWQDSEINNPGLPGPQIYRLDSPGGQWQVEYELPKTMVGRWGVREYQALSNLAKVSFTKDKDGHTIAPAAELLVAGVFSRGTGIDVFLRSPSGRWSYDPIPPQSYLPRGAQIRPFAVHTDSVTGAEMIFAGSGDVIFSGKYNARTQTIEWNAYPDWLGPTPGKNNIQSHGGRITGLTECEGKLYAAGRDVYEREDGPQPNWKSTFTLPRGETAANLRGFSGLTCASGPSGRPTLFSSFQGASADIVRIDLDRTGARGSVELNVPEFLSGVLRTEATTAIVAYNDMTIYPTADLACPSLLMGFSVHTPNEPETFASTRKYPGAGFLVRGCKGNYTVQWVQDPSLQTIPKLVAVRAITVSPFAQDPAGTIYAGGFDAGNAPARGVHNTAWLYKGVPNR